jgi:hypothetical protein
MAGPDDDDIVVAGLIERLLVDPEFRAEFRRDPAAVCTAAGLPGLAADLGGSGKAMQTLELRESRSSLAGVVMAVAVEGIGVAEAQALVRHGLPGGLGKALHGVRLPRGLQRGVSPAGLEHKVEHGLGLRGAPGKGLVGGSAPATAAPAGAGGAASGTPVPAVSAPAGSSAAPVTAPAGTAGAAPTTGGAGAAPAAAPAAATPPAPAPAAAAPAGSAAVSAPAGSSAAGVIAPAGPGTAGAAPTGGVGLAPAAPVPAAAGSAGSGGAGVAVTGGGGSGAAGAAPVAPVPAAAGSGGSGAAGVAVTGGGAGSGGAGAASPAPASAGAGAAGAGSGVPWPDQVPAAGGASQAPAAGAVGGLIAQGSVPGGIGTPPAVGLAGLLDSPQLSAGADVRAWLAGGGVQPRIVSVLDSVLAHHSIGIANIESVSAPVHAQALDIVSVDGQPVGPDNFAARDLVTEIAAMDPSMRPDEIGTPWPIQSPGFFSDQSSVASLHLAFEMPGTNSPALGAAANAGTPGATPPPAASVGTPGASPPPAASGYPAGTYPAAGYPAAAGVAQPADAALAAGSAPAAAPVPASAAPVGDLVGQGTPSPAHELAAPGPSSNSSAYVNPLPKDAQIGRTDMGVDVDLKPGEPIVAPGDSRVLGVMQNWYAGQPYVALQLLDGPMKGHNYYVAEQINLAVTPGQVVRQGQPIAHYASSGTGIEIGWAGSNWEQTLAQSQGNTGDASHNDAPAGQSFSDFLKSLTTPAPSASDAAAPAASATTPTPDAVSAGSAGAPPVPAGSGVPAAAAVGAPAAAGGVAGVAGAPSAAGGVAGVAVTPTAAGGVPPVATPPPAPGTAAFKAVENQGSASHRHTVQFLKAVQPAPVSPAAPASPPAASISPPAAPISPPAAPAGGTPPIGQPPSGQAAVESLSPGQGQVAPAGAPVVQQVAGQGPGALPVGAGAISVSSSLLTSGQETFAAHVAQLTGLSPRVVAAWELAEESGGAAQSRQAASNFNWLNIGYFDSGAGQIAFDKTFGDPVSAAEQTAKFLKGEWGGASSSIRAILSTVGQSPDQQMAAIANSDWASSHYGGGANLRGTYQELGDLKVQSTAAT